MPQDLSVAVLTDVHGNAFAIQAVVLDIEAERPDLTVNLGDQVWGQADPMTALEVQRSLGALEVRGNNDERLTLPGEQLSSAHRKLQNWLARQLPAHERQRLATLPLTVTLADGAVLAAHGTPTSAWDSLLLSWDGQTFAHRPEADVLERLNLPEAVEVVLVGHMHRESTRHVGGRLLVNVGPVAYQNDGDPRARWALLTRRRGVWTVQHHRVEYDTRAAARWMAANHAPHLEETELHLRPVTDPIRNAAFLSNEAAQE